MTKCHSQRKSCIDVFNAFLVQFSEYAGIYEFPRIDATYAIPNKLISFSKCISCNNFDQWVHFYEDDYLFERIWRNPKRYLHILKRYNGIISPDFSLYRDMPFVMQLWNIYRSRAIGSWLQNNGINVIPNLRFGDKRSFSLCCEGIEKNSVIAIGTHGTLKNPMDRNIFLNGLDSVVGNRLIMIGNGKHGYERIYNYKGSYYVMTGIGTNGFIVSAYPIRKDDL